MKNPNTEKLRSNIAKEICVDRSAEAAYQEKCVKYLLTSFDLDSEKWTLLRQCEQQTGERKLTLGGFCQHFANFPFLLHSLAAKVSESDRLHFVLKNFQQSFFRPWLRRRVEFPTTDHRPIGLILKWPYVSHGLLLHADAEFAQGDGIRLTWQVGRAKLYAEPLGQVVARLRPVWRAE